MTIFVFLWSCMWGITCMCVDDHSSTSFPETRSQLDLELAHMVTLAGQLALGRSSSFFLRLKFQGAATLPLPFPWVSRDLNTGSQAYMAIALTPSHLPSEDIVLLGYFIQLFIRLTAGRYSIGLSPKGTGLYQNHHFKVIHSEIQFNKIS